MAFCDIFEGWMVEGEMDKKKGEKKWRRCGVSESYQFQQTNGDFLLQVCTDARPWKIRLWSFSLRKSSQNRRPNIQQDT